jgi:tetratricopeptide (TPR) repeat protein
MVSAAKRGIFAILIVILTAGFARAQVPELIRDPQFKKVARAAVDSIYNFNFEAADSLLAPWKQQHPDHPLWLLMEGMTLWWHVLSDLTDTSQDERFFYLMKKADYASSRLLQKNSSHADGLIIKAVSNGYIARQYSNRDEWMASLNHARRALSAHEYLSELYPEMGDLKLAEGLKLYYSAYLPEAYPIVNTVSWFLPEGSKTKGLALMQQASNSAVFARAEATYFMGNINYNYEDNYDAAARYFEELYRKYPHNNYYVRLLVKSYYRMRRYDAALKVIDDSIERWDEKDLPYGEVVREELMYWRGRIYSRRHRYKEAMVSYREAYEAGKSLPRLEYRPYHAAAGYYLGKLHCDNHDYSQAREYLKSVTSARVDSGYKSLAKEILSTCEEK